jgi:signal transduction histidine kinase
MNILFNLDLLLNSINIAAIIILGLVVFINGPKSRTNRIFLIFALIAIAYAIINYFSYNTNNPVLVLWLLRLVLFSSVWYSFVLFHFVHIFSNPNAILPRLYKFVLIPVTTLISIVTLSPLAFPRIEYVAPIGQVTNPVRGPGMAFFGIAVTFFVFGSITILIDKVLRSKASERLQFIFILIGTSITYTLIIIFNFILPVIFNNLTYIPLAPLFTIPFIAFTTYAIIKHHLFNVRVVATELLIFALWLTLLIITVRVSTVSDMILHVIVFVATVVLGIFLIRSVLQEVRTREKMQQLALDLEITNKELKTLDEAKSDFISIASHQLRTPLYVV